MVDNKKNCSWKSIPSTSKEKCHLTLLLINYNTWCFLNLMALPLYQKKKSNTTINLFKWGETTQSTSLILEAYIGTDE